jgi:uncharacterized Fe-S cluster-containing radical SAM superfamily protein
MSSDKPGIPFCKAPWHSISLAPTGKLGPCCLIPFGFGDLSEGDTLQSAWEGPAMKSFRQNLLDHKLAPGCLECKAKEADGFVSAKSIFDKIAEIGPITEPYTVDADLKHFYHLDISLSNKCNLKCRFCYSGNSTAWFKERDLMLEENKSLYSDSLGTTDKIIDIPPKELEAFVQNLTNLDQIEIKGGEPFMSKGHLPFLEMLIENKQAQKVDLLYTANGTVFQPAIFPLWKKFRNVSFTVSVDGVGSVYQYVRGGRLTLESDVVPHLQQILKESLRNLSLNLHYTICVYNLFDVVHFLKWHQNSNLNCSVSFGLVDTPQYLSIRLMPRELILVAIEQLTPYSQNHSVEKLIKALSGLTPATDSAILQNQFFNYTESLDKIRKVSLLKEIPDLIPFYESLRERFLSPQQKISGSSHQAQ